MKNLLERMKHYSFWLSFSGALIVFINCLGKIFNFEIENEIVENVIMSIAGLLVVFGLVTKDGGNKGDGTAVNDTLNEISDNQTEIGNEQTENNNDKNEIEKVDNSNITSEKS